MGQKMFVYQLTEQYQYLELSNWEKSWYDWIGGKNRNNLNIELIRIDCAKYSNKNSIKFQN